MEYEVLKEGSTNFARIAGVVASAPEKSHEVEGEAFYEFKVEVDRLSDKKDVIPVTVSERTLLEKSLKQGDFVDVVGEYRSYNKMISEKSRLILHLFAKELEVCAEKGECVNEVKLTGPTHADVFNYYARYIAGVVKHICHTAVL